MTQNSNDNAVSTLLPNLEVDESDKALLHTSQESIKHIRGPLIFLAPMRKPTFGGMLSLELPDGTERGAQIIDASEKAIIAQVFEGTHGLPRHGTKVIQQRDIFRMKVSDAMLGVPLSGIGEPLEGDKVQIHPEAYLEITGDPINPAARAIPRAPIETGVPAIDGLNTLVRGQKLPIFTGPGLPAGELATRIAKHVSASAGGDVTVVFGAIGITRREGSFYMRELGGATGASNIAFFLNFVDDPTVERILTPRCALTLAEYLAFEKGRDVLVILADMLSYAEALREIGTAREEIPGRRGFPGYLYTDLATIYERAGRIHGREGSVTQLSVVSMPNNDITHPVPDLTGYITEGQIVLSADLHYKGIQPPIDVLPSLSRLMNAGIGEGFTRADHKFVSNQLYAAYAHGRKLRQLIAITGEESLSRVEKLYLRFADIFEQHFVSSRPRSFDETIDLGWDLLGVLPENELIRIPEELLQKRFKKTELSDFMTDETGAAISKEDG